MGYSRAEVEWNRMLRELARQPRCISCGSVAALMKRPCPLERCPDEFRVMATREMAAKLAKQEALSARARATLGR